MWPGRAAQHLLGLDAHGVDHLAAADVAQRHDRGLVQHDALALHVDQGVGRAEVDGDVVGDHAEDAKTALSGSQTGRTGAAGGRANLKRRPPRESLREDSVSRSRADLSQPSARSSAYFATESVDYAAAGAGQLQRSVPSPARASRDFRAPRRCSRARRSRKRARDQHQRQPAHARRRPGWPRSRPRRRPPRS